MKKCLILAVAVVFLGGWAPHLLAQTVVQRSTQPRVQYPAYNSIYCSGFITDRPIVTGLYIEAGEEGGLRNEFIPGDVVFLSKGAANIVNPGGEYMVLRKMVDVDKQEIYPGQRRILEQLGTYYSEVGRIHVNILRPEHAIAEVRQACESIAVGDILVPFDVKPAPPLKASAGFDRFAPPSGKATGRIVAARDWTMLLRTGDIGYVDIGSKDGLQVGQYLRAYRPFTGSYVDLYRRYENQYPSNIGGMKLSVPLSEAERKSLPRDVQGEVIVLHVEGRSATVMVTFAQKDIIVGDDVEVE